jgi:hypothetical protein
LTANVCRHLGCGCSSVVEHDLAKVGVEGSSPFARSRFSWYLNNFAKGRRKAAFLFFFWGSLWGSDNAKLIGHHSSPGYACRAKIRILFDHTTSSEPAAVFPK